MREPAPLVASIDHIGMVDALYRFAAGQDLRDRELLESAFTAEAELDFRGPAGRLGAEVPLFEGRRGIVEAIIGSIRNLDTTHTVSNPRVTASDGAHASLVALVEAQHLPRADHSRHLLLKNFYFADLVRDGSRWLIERLRIENVWYDGEPSVLFPRPRGALDDILEDTHA
ncbi:MAG TPA: nuclear transport factor 2 family protein [Dokdonella sp.]